MLVVAVGLLGAVGLQLAATRYQQTATQRAQAMEQANAIAEKMRTNNAILAVTNLGSVTAAPSQGYLATQSYAAAALGSPTPTNPPNPNCGTNCSAAQQAQLDLFEWRLALQQALPGGRGSLFPVAVGNTAQPNARRVVVMWNEKPDNAADTQANINAALGTDGTDPACPAPRVAGVRCFNLWVTP